MASSSNVVPMGALKQKNADPKLDVELGVGNVMPGGSWSDWSGGANPRGTFTVGRDPTAPTISELVRMIRRDGQARALLNLFTLPMRAALKNSEWKAPEDADPDCPEVKFANDMWNLPPSGGGMSVAKSKLLRQALLGIPHGFAAFEHVRHIPDDGPLQGKITLRKLAYRDPRTIYFLTDENGGFAGVRQVASFADRTVNVIIPQDKVWFFTANEEENPFYGVSYFEPAYEHFQIKRKLYFIAHLAAQFAAVPGRMGKLPQSPNRGQLEQFRAALKNFAMDTSMLIPFGYEVEPFNNSTQFDFLKYIDHHNLMMATSVLAKFLQQEDRQVLIDNGKADASADMFVQMLQAIMDEIAESWSRHVMPQYIDYNFNSGIYPEFRFAPLTDDQKATLTGVFQTLVVASTLNCTPEFMRQTEEHLATELGYDIPYEEIAEKEKAAAELAAKQAQDQADAAAAMPQDPNAPPGPGGPPGAPGAGGVPNAAPTPPGPPKPPTPPQQQIAASALADDVVEKLLQLAVRADSETPAGLPEDPGVNLPDSDDLSALTELPTGGS